MIESRRHFNAMKTKGQEKKVNEMMSSWALGKEN